MTTQCAIEGCGHPVTPCTGACTSKIEQWRTQAKADVARTPLPTIEPNLIKSALDIQVGGDHYKKLPIQPMEYSMKNKLDACQHTAIKYITRFRDKGGVADLEKAKHVIDMLIEFERGAA